MVARNNELQWGVRQVDAAGRRWYTQAFKQRIVAACVEPDASISKVAIDHGLNPNLVRKWLAGTQREVGPANVPMLLPVVANGEPVADVEKPAERSRYVIEVQIGKAVILVSEHARPELVRAVVQSLG